MYSAANPSRAMLFAILALTGCATPQERRAAEVAAAAENVVADLAVVVEEMRAEAASMSPAEQDAMGRRLDAGIRRDFHNSAARCGTAIRLTDAPNVMDSIVIIRADATPAQVDCVQLDIPFALPAAIGDEFPDIVRNCELLEARLMQNADGEGYVLALPREIHAARDRAPAQGRIACVIHWARERGLALTLAEALY